METIRAGLFAHRMNVVSASWVLGWNNKGMVSKAYSPPLHPVLLPFGGHGEHRQIVIGIDDAVLEILLADTDAPARTPFVAHHVSLCWLSTRCG